MSSSIFSNISEETVRKIEQFAESFEQFVQEKLAESRLERGGRDNE